MAATVTFTQVPVISGTGVYSVASMTGWAINASGQVVGYGTVRTSSVDPGHTQGWFYNGTTTSDINPNGLDGTATTAETAYAINASGAIAGYVTNTTLNGTRAFVTSGGSMTGVDDYDPTIGQSRAYGIRLERHHGRRRRLLHQQPLEPLRLQL